MPELPEVETIVRDLRPRVEGRTFGAVEVLRPDLLRVSPDVFRDGIEGHRLEALGRRGKNLVFRLDGGPRLVVNLGMTGRLLAGEGVRESAHPGVRFGLQGGGEMVYDDVRRFGVLELLSPETWAERSAGLGPEPLADGFTPDDLAAALSRSRSPARSWLLDQRKVAGVGNIYANEALHRAGVHPARPARSLDRGEARSLHRALRNVLREALRARGTTLRDYRDSSGERGDFGSSLRVYGRDGEPCPDCGEVLRRIVFGNRSAFFCPSCQPEPSP